MEPSAKIIADSITEQGHRLATLEVVMHRFVLAEWNTHRVFSRNSASSRAIPFPRQVQRVREHLAYPLVWASEQKGMQGGDEIEDADLAKGWWLSASERAVEAAEHIARFGVHKSVVNRLLEPFMWHTVIVSSTDFENFFSLRRHWMAQPEIRAAAEAMWEVYEPPSVELMATVEAMEKAYRDSEPRLLREGEWHLPYIDDEDWDALGHRLESMMIDPLPEGEDPRKLRIVRAWVRQISAARCARVSLLTHDGKREHEADLGLFERLSGADPMHASPFEHVATPDFLNIMEGGIFNWADPDDHKVYGVRVLPQVGNFVGWRQFRREMEDLKFIESISKAGQTREER